MRKLFLFQKFLVTLHRFLKKGKGEKGKGKREKIISFKILFCLICL